MRPSKSCFYLLLGIGICLRAHQSANAEVIFGTHPITFPQGQTGLFTYGTAAASLDDLNGDGIGEIGVKSTRAGISPQRDVWVLSGTTGATLFGISSPATGTGYVSFGNSLASVPDVDGDSKEDLLIGAPQEPISGGTTGRVYLYSTGTGLLLRQFQSPIPNFEFGVSVHGCNDLDGDGSGDAIIGALKESTSPGNQGVVYVFSGATGVLIRTITSPTPETIGWFGQSVALLNCEGGSPVLVVGAPRESVPGFSDAGRVHLFDLQTGAFLFSIVSTNPKISGGFGSTVAALPTSSQDPPGCDDIVIRAPLENNTSGSTTGAVHVHSSDSGSLRYSLYPPHQQNADFGKAICCRADLNEDGVSDIIVGAPLEDHTAADVGAVHCYSGLDGLLFRTIIPYSPINTTQLKFGSAITIQGTFPTHGSIAITLAFQANHSFNRHYFYVTGDCNSDAVADHLNIAAGQLSDCDLDGIPDECATHFLELDCNENSVGDYCDVQNGTSLDANSDQIPDECPTNCISSDDCNHDSIPDSAQLAGNDCDSDAVPDDCQIDRPFMTRVSETASGEPAIDINATAYSGFYGAAMSDDSSVVVFSSLATNLIHGVNNGEYHVFLMERDTGLTTVIDRANGQLSNSYSVTPDISSDGNYVTFMSAGDLLGPVEYLQIYLFEKQTSTLLRVSNTTAGAPANGHSFSPSISADGRYVVFLSSATNLTADDTSGYVDLFRFDRMTGNVELLTRGWRGEPSDGHTGYVSGASYFSPVCAAVSGDGRYVAFESAANNLSPLVFRPEREVYLHDCVTGNTEICSINGLGEEGPGVGAHGQQWSYAVSVGLSRDGRFVAFETTSQLEMNDSVWTGDIYIRDRLLQSTNRLEVNGTSSNRFIAFPQFSADACYVSFVSNLKGIAPYQSTNTSPSALEVFRYRMSDGTIDLVSRSAVNRPGNKASGSVGIPRISADGQSVLFISSANNLTVGPISPRMNQVFLAYLPGQLDCDGNNIPDGCELGDNDCNHNGVFDECECYCVGDVNSDARLDGLDIDAFIGCLMDGCESGGCYCADFDANGQVDVQDASNLADMLVGTSSGTCQ